MSIITEGYRLPFTQVPHTKVLHNNKSAFVYAIVVEQAIQELIISNRVMEVHQTPYAVNLLSVSIQSSGK